MEVIVSSDILNYGTIARPLSRNAQEMHTHMIITSISKIMLLLSSITLGLKSDSDLDIMIP
jgi:hypothetical protein